jgi:SAM-dependent methyltransferase
MLRCSVCGCTAFISKPVLWSELISEWQLSPAEVHYVNRQQGTACQGCGARLRCIALADAIRAAVGTKENLLDFVHSSDAGGLTVLEINEAGTLTPTLSQLQFHILAAFPEVDIHAMPYPDCSFDLVLHSDTLEHVANPVHALTECRRVLKPGGALCFTVPSIVGRLTRDRVGLPASYHGFPGTVRDDHIVFTEFGADAWSYVVQAGFANVSIVTVDFPSAIAFMARRED